MIAARWEEEVRWCSEEGGCGRVEDRNGEGGDEYER